MYFGNTVINNYYKDKAICLNNELQLAMRKSYHKTNIVPLESKLQRPTITTDRLFDELQDIVDGRLEVLPYDKHDCQTFARHGPAHISSRDLLLTELEFFRDRKAL